MTSSCTTACYLDMRTRKLSHFSWGSTQLLVHPAASDTHINLWIELGNCGSSALFQDIMPGVKHVIIWCSEPSYSN